MTTAAGKELAEELGAEGAVLLIPAEAFEHGGSYEKLRVAADAICRAELTKPLPAEWQDLFYVVGWPGRNKGGLKVFLWGW